MTKMNSNQHFNGPKNASNNAELELTLLNKPAEQLLNGSLPNNGNGNSLNGKSGTTRAAIKPQGSQEELIGGIVKSVENGDDNPPGGDGNSIHNTNKSLSASETAIQERMETATADVIISEYPAECFPEHMYKYCPWCLNDTQFWARWRELRLKCYKCVENKYFETLVITLILISSMCLVSCVIAPFFRVVLFIFV